MRGGAAAGRAVGHAVPGNQSASTPELARALPRGRVRSRYAAAGRGFAVVAGRREPRALLPGMEAARALETLREAVDVAAAAGGGGWQLQGNVARVVAIASAGDGRAAV